jgi:hypothetical protein
MKRSTFCWGDKSSSNPFWGAGIGVDVVSGLWVPVGVGCATAVGVEVGLEICGVGKLGVGVGVFFMGMSLFGGGELKYIMAPDEMISRIRRVTTAKFLVTS